MIRRLFIFILIALWAAFCVEGEETNFFPVMAWNSVPPDLAVLKKMRECGLTVAGFVAPKTVKLCRKAGLKAIVSDPRTSGYDWTKLDERAARRKVASLIREVGKNPAVYGYYLRDEPGANFFQGLATIAGLVREMAPDKWAYINLFPNYATPDQLGVATYQEYVQKFCDECHPRILSYDHYALMEDGSMGGLYWKNLEAMRAAALRNHLPFWNIVQAMGMLSFREPTAADFRFQVYSSLAYGARGLAYFQYFASGVGNFRAAAVDEFGHPTATWGYMQNVNLQIAALAPTLLQLTSDDVYHLGKAPEGCHGPTATNLVAGVDGGDFMAGDFSHADGSRYVMIVNKSFTRSAYGYPHFRGVVKRVESISPYSGQRMDFRGENCWLAPGQGVLLRLE